MRSPRRRSSGARSSRAAAASEPLRQTALERLAIVIAAFVLAIGAIAALSGYFAGRDQAGVSGGGAGPGQAFPDQGAAHLRPGEQRPEYNSDPPTSGPHVPTAVRRDRARLTDDQLLEALARGDVVLAYGTRKPPAGLPALARGVAAPFSPALADAGQAVILDRRPGTHGVIALAWRHLLRSGSPTDPALRAFATFWLGRGAAAHR